MMKSAMPSIPDETLKKLTNKNKKEAIETFLYQLNGKSQKKTTSKFTDQIASAGAREIDQTSYHSPNEDSDEDINDNVTIRKIKKNQTPIPKEDLQKLGNLKRRVKTNQKLIDKTNQARENLEMNREETLQQMYPFRDQTAGSGNYLFGGDGSDY